ncbi:MAG: DUF5686 family protein [Schleiferiaceae bacterium]|jgi:hypothetical protein|nr:DUF5686 family protein [Schleiferiaceae bacterium]MDP4877579.1 DUF5686 family protein [Schleiferiaceae bacterium]MDP4959844.1 DUF5686 family protein [Schleiferiaceae bacterium]
MLKPIFGPSLFAGIFLFLSSTHVLGQNDTSIVLQQVTVIDHEDPAKVLVRDLRQNWRNLERSAPTNLKYYSRKYSSKTSAVDFEQVAHVFFEDLVMRQEIQAFRDYSKYVPDDGRSVRFDASFNLNPSFDFNGDQDAGILEKYPEMNFDRAFFYPFSSKELPQASARTVSGLFEWDGWSVYEFRWLREYLFAGESFVELGFEPRPGKSGWKGTMLINASQLRPVSFKGTVGVLTLEQTYTKGHLFSNASIIMKNAAKNSVFEWKLEGVDLPIEPTVKRAMQVGSVPIEQMQDLSYWEQYRPEGEELDQWTRRQDSLIRYLNSDDYLDSMDAIYNAFHWYEPLVSGVGYRKRSQGTNFYLSPLIGQWNLLGIGGVRWRPTMVLGKRFENDNAINFYGNLNYGFKNQDMKGSVDVGYTYAPLHNGSVHFRVGDTYDQITQSVDLTGLLARSNFIQKTFVESYHKYEWFNGFYTRLGIEYSKRQSIEGLEFADWSNDLFGSRNQPGFFETYTVAQLSAEILIRPFQRYYLKGRQKIVLSSRWPDFRWSLKQGIPNVFGSDVRYTKYEFQVEDMVRWGALGESFYNVVSGGFLNDPSTVRFIEYKWFRGGDFLLFTNPLFTMQSLPETFASPEVYVQAFGIHHFDGFLFDRIPGVNRLGFSTAAGFSALYLPNSNFSHLETYVGLERKVKLWQTPTRFGLYYLTSPSDANPGFRLKIGVDVKDTFKDRWNF